MEKQEEKRIIDHFTKEGFKLFTYKEGNCRLSKSQVIGKGKRFTKAIYLGGVRSQLACTYYTDNGQKYGKEVHFNNAEECISRMNNCADPNKLKEVSTAMELFAEILQKFPKVTHAH